MPKKSFIVEIFAVSLAAILLEISYTRVFSFKVWYYFTYLIIGVALLGLGTGGVLVAIWTRLREAEPHRLISRLCFSGGASVLVGYLCIAPLQLNISLLGSSPAEIVKLLVACLLLMAPFLATGIIISKILSTSPETAGRLYCGDLLGAALGCIACIPLLLVIGPPKVIILAGVIFTLAGMRSIIHSPSLLGIGAVASSLMILFLVTNGLLPDPVVARSKYHWASNRGGEILLSKWHPVFRVDVAKSETEPGRAYNLLHDGHLGSRLTLFDGDLSGLEYLGSDSRALPFEVLKKGPRVLIIGAAGGHEILSSLYFGASHITAVELNPVTVSLLTDTYAGITGRLSENPRVTLINGEGRWFMKQDKEKYDLIWFVAPDSYAAMNASSAAGFVLAENYLYTCEMLKESLEHLTDQGIICTQFGEWDFARKPSRTTRYAATARQAFEEKGIRPFEHHVLVSSVMYDPPLSLSTILLSKSSFEFEQIKRFREKVGQIDGGKVEYSPDTRDATPVNQVITLPREQLDAWYKEYAYLVDPVYDDSPYFWHFARFRDAITTSLGLSDKQLFSKETIAERVSIVLLVLAIVFAAFFLLLPFAAIHRTWVKIPHKMLAGVYFSSLGLGFMFIEVALIQMLTLFLGYPTRSLSVTLFGLLLFSGIGSLLSERYTARRNRVLGILMSALVVIVLFYQFGLPIVSDMFVGRSLGLRISLTIMMLAPLGLCLGAFMPLGLTTIAATTPHKREYVAWAWAVNGFFSVAASILSTILAMIVGFKLVLLLALVIYAIGILALTRLSHAAG